jgi:hypothetical protein
MEMLSVEIDQNAARREVHDWIMQAHPRCNFKTTSGHKNLSPIGHYSLRRINIEERKAAASVLLCMATDLEMARLSSLIKLPEDLDVPDFDVKVVRMGFSSDFGHAVVLAQPTDRGMLPMYSMTKFLVGVFPNLKYAFKTGSCSAILDMGTIVVGARDLSGLVCRDPCSEQNWMAGPGLPSDSLIQASHQAAETGLPVYRSAVQTGQQYMIEPTALPYEWEYGGFLAALHRSGFVQAGHEVGQASVVIDNYRNLSLLIVSPPVCMENLCKFWNIFFSTI